MRKPRMLIPLVLAAGLLLSLIGNSATGALAATPAVHVTMPPVGLSFEYPTMAQDLGTAACPAPALVSELLRLGSPPLSLAGSSQDVTVPSEAAPGPSSSWEAATLYPLPPDFWSQLHCLLSGANDPLTVGINVKTGELSWAQQMVAGAQSSATNGLAFSLGNEPDLYALPNYSSLGKPQLGEEALEVNLYLQLATRFQQALGGAPVIGPELATAAHWRLELPRVISQLHEQTVGVHSYPLTDCTSPRAVTIGGLLSESAADAPSRLAWVVADANSAGVPAIISEANSASCGGKTGVSDSPAAAVWAVRFVLSALKTGFREVRFHFSGDPYDPFIVRGSEVVDRPLDSALVALNQWLPVGSSLETVSAARGLVATAVSGQGGVRLIVDNERAKAAKIVMRSTQAMHTELLSAVAPGLQMKTFPTTHGRVKLSISGNTVLAVLSGP